MKKLKTIKPQLLEPHCLFLTYWPSINISISYNEHGWIVKNKYHSNTQTLCSMQMIPARTQSTTVVPNHSSYNILLNSSSVFKKKSIWSVLLPITSHHWLWHSYRNVYRSSILKHQQTQTRLTFPQNVRKSQHQTYLRESNNHCGAWILTPTEDWHKISVRCLWTSHYESMCEFSNCIGKSLSLNWFLLRAAVS